MSEEEISLSKKSLKIAQISMALSIISTAALIFISVAFGIAQLPEKPNILINGWYEKNMFGSEITRECYESQIYNCSFNYDQHFNKYQLKPDYNFSVYKMVISNEGKSTSNINILFSCNFELIGIGVAKLGKEMEYFVDLRGSLPFSIIIKEEGISSALFVNLYGAYYLPDAICHIIYSSQDISKKEKDVVLRNISR